MGKHTEARGNKRKFGSGKGAHHPTPRRGPPAVFVSCESGRERKCQREALELLHHYYYASRPPLQKEAESENTPSSTEPKSSDDQPLSLEEELSMLRKGAAAEEVLLYEPSSKRPRTASTKGSMKSPFSIYDTGMRGIVCILCNLPESEMVPYENILAEIRAAKEKEGGDDTTNVATGDDSKKEGEGNENSKADNDDPKSRVTEDNVNIQKETDSVLWDPVDTVKCIMRDAKLVNKDDGDETNNLTPINDGGKDTEHQEGEKKEVSVSKELLASPPPGSRFILRMLPMQATCYASVDEIKAVSMSLLKRFLPKFPAILSKDGKDITFKLEIKRRLCSHLTQDQVIEAVAPMVLGGLDFMPGYKFSVNLGNPDFSIRIETCKSLGGVSILPRESWHKNFNLAELTNPTERKKTVIK